MRIVELHPEDLLDKESRGTLGWADRVALQAHAARCVVCRFERRLRGELAAMLREESDAMRGQLARASGEGTRDER